MKPEDDLELRKLRRRRKRAKNSGDSAELCEVYLELGDHHRMVYHDERKAAVKYEKCINHGKQAANHLNMSFAYRSLATIALNEEADQSAERAMKNIYKALGHALNSGNASQIQLICHQRAYIFDQCGEHEKAYEQAHKSLKYLATKRQEIDSDQVAIAAGCGKSDRRKAGLENLLGSICFELDKVDEARQHNEACYKYASGHSDWELLIKALDLRLRMTKGKGRLAIAKEMRDVAERTDKKSASRPLALYHFGCEQINSGRVFPGRRHLWSLFKTRAQNLDKLNQEGVKKALMFTYKLERRLEKIRELEKRFDNFEDDERENKIEQTRIYEKIADEATELKFFDSAFNYYHKMFEISATREDRRAALISLAATACDQGEKMKALKFYERLLELERSMGLPDTELLCTEISIAICKVEDTNASMYDRLETMREVYAKCHTDTVKYALLPEYVKLLSKARDDYLIGADELDVKKADLEALEVRMQQRQGEEEANLASIRAVYADEVEAMNEMEIVKEIKKQMREIEYDERLEKQRNTLINNEGETNLHVTARTGDWRHLEKLIKMGYDVNKLDHGGWSPLSEAVIHGNDECAELLLRHCANVNTQSREGLLSKEGDENRATAGRQSPLMEACTNGSVSMIKLLLKHKANVTLVDDDKWTALDHLNDYLFHNRDVMEEGLLAEFIGLKEQMENKLRAAGLQPRPVPPPRRLRPKPPRPSVPLPPCSRKRRRAAGDDSSDEDDGPTEEERSRRNLEDYRREMKRLGPRITHAEGGSGGGGYVINTSNPDTQRQGRFMAAAERNDARQMQAGANFDDDNDDLFLHGDRAFLVQDSDDDGEEDVASNDGSEHGERRGGGGGTRRPSNRRTFLDDDD